MAAVAEPLLTTVEEYRELPTRDDVVQELRWGQVVTLTRPKMGPSKLLYRLLELLRPRIGNKGIVASEVPFRTLPQYELRGADVAFVSQGRWMTTRDDVKTRSREAGSRNLSGSEFAMSDREIATT